MQRVASNCRNRYYGDSPLMPTMATFGHALAQHELHEGVQIGNVVSVRWRSYKRGFRLGGGGLVAARKPPRAKAGNISNLGVTGTNNYVHLWKARDIYQGLEGG